MNRLALFVRRGAAYLIDCLAIGVYAIGLAGVSLALAPNAQLSNLAGFALALVTLTGLVVVAFEAMEARFGASPGKALLGLLVSHGAGRPGFLRALVRNIGKFLPWEIAHIGIWVTPGQPFVDPPPDLSVALWAVSGAGVGVQALLVAVFMAGLHDWISGLRVVRSPG